MPEVVKDTLYYSAIDNKFYFYTDALNIVKVHMINRIRTTEGIMYSIPGWYPDGYIAIKDVKAILPNVTATQKALDRIQYLKSVPDKIKNLEYINSIDYQFKYPPYNHQLECIECLLHMPNLAILAEQGLGKTFIVLNYLAIKSKLTGQKYRTLVLAPKIVLRNWELETEKYTDLKVVVYQGTAGKRKELREYLKTDNEWDIIVTNYEAISTKQEEDFKFFRDELSFKCIVMDEGSRLKGHNSKRSVGVQQIADNIFNKIILSGTITLGSPLDIYMPFTILNRHIFGSNFYKFRNKFCEYSPYNKHVVIGYKNLDILKNRIDPYTIVKNREDCIDLPPRTIAEMYYELSKEQRKLYNAIVSQDKVEVNGREVDVSLPIIKLNKLRQVLSGFMILPLPRNTEKCDACEYLQECVLNSVYPWEHECFFYDGTVSKPEQEVVTFKNSKLDLLKEHLELLLEREDKTNNKVIIWTFFKKEMEDVTNALKDLKIKYVTPSDDNCTEVFEKDDSVLVFIGQISQGIGITLNKATYTIYYSHSLKLEDRLQSMDRNYRIGQTNKVVVYDYVAKETIEEQVLRLLNDKKDVKDFIHSNVECETCPRFIHCFERGIIPYSEKCLLYEKRAKAETRNIIRLSEV